MDRQKTCSSSSAPKSLILSLPVYPLQLSHRAQEQHTTGLSVSLGSLCLPALRGKGLFNEALGAAVRCFRRIVLGRQNIKQPYAPGKKCYIFWEVTVKMMWGFAQRCSIVADEALILKLDWLPLVSLSIGCHQSIATQQCLPAMPVQVSHVSPGK